MNAPTKRGRPKKPRPIPMNPACVAFVEALAGWAARRALQEHAERNFAVGPRTTSSPPLRTLDLGKSDYDADP